MTESHRIGVIRGDGTGPEVIEEGLKVLEAVATAFGIELVDFDLRRRPLLRTGDVLPRGELEQLAACDAIFLERSAHPE